MFINEVISYNGAWECLNKESQNLITELENLLENIDISFIDHLYAEGKYDVYDLTVEIFSHI